MKEMISNSLFFGPAVSLAAYEIGLIIKKKYKLAILNPLLLATVIVMGVLCITKIEYEHYNESAKYLSYFLTPATVALAVPLYEQLSLLKEHFTAVISGIISGVLASLLSVLFLAALFGLDHQQYVTLLPKSITTAIGMGVSEELGGILADVVYKLFRIREPVAKGLALGTASHAIGTAKAMELGEIEGAMSSLAIAVAGLLTVVGASVFAQFM